ncbi:MAG TPA: FkbM family methyltransferase [Pirellulaceae bacterium]|nr:FkbM family methyltransferase [Pirellulaceae bacterium]
MLANLPLRHRPPWHFRLAKWMIRHRIPGGYHLVELGERMGWLDCLVRYRLSDRVSVDVPLNRRETQWAEPDLWAYEGRLVAVLALALEALRRPVTWIDCGADIGTLTALTAAHSPQIDDVIAIEPNPQVQDLLARNMTLLPFPARALAVAVADFQGRGRLEHFPTLRSDHSRFLVPDEQGGISVTRLDDLDLPEGKALAIKIDVEGGELAVLQGAANALRNAPAWIVAFEAHRLVAERSGIDPCACVRLLLERGASDAIVAEAPGLRLDPQQPYFEQVRDLKVSNVVCMKRS